MTINGQTALLAALPALLEKDVLMNPIVLDETPSITFKEWPKDHDRIQKVFMHRGNMRPLTVTGTYDFQNDSFEVSTAQQGERLHSAHFYKDSEISNLTPEHPGSVQRRQREMFQSAQQLLNAFKLMGFIKAVNLQATNGWLVPGIKLPISAAELAVPASVTAKVQKMIVEVDKTHLNGNYMLLVSPDIYTSLMNDNVLVDKTLGNDNGGVSMGTVKTLMGYEIMQVRRMPGVVIDGASKAEYTYLKDIRPEFELTAEEEAVVALFVDRDTVEFYYNNDELKESPDVKYFSNGPITVLYQGSGGGANVPGLAIIAQTRPTIKLFNSKGGYLYKTA